MNFTVIPTVSAEHIAKNLSEKYGLKIMYPQKNKEGKRCFPDGEVYIRLPEAHLIEGRTVILHAGSPDPNGGLIELEMLLGILNQAGAGPLEVFFTYFPYAMQDHEFQTGELCAAEALVKKLANYYNVKKIYIIDAHFHGQSWEAKYPIKNIPTHNLLLAAVAKDYPEVVYLAPDQGSERRTKIKGLEKKRTDSYNVEMKTEADFGQKVAGRIVGVVDDLVETGGTMHKFYDTCIQAGASEVVALITHGVLVSGIERLKNKYKKLYLTNTINRKEANVDVTELVFRAVSAPLELPLP